MMMSSCLVLTYNRSLMMVVYMVLSLALLTMNYHSFTYIHDLMSVVSVYSSSLCWLSSFILLSALLVTMQEKSVWYQVSILAMMLTLMGCFSVSSFIMFYITFETALIPIMILIISWGYQPERLQASSYMLLYTVIASLPMLLSSLYIYSFLSSFNILVVSQIQVDLSVGMFVVMMLPFLVKLPIYGGHLWLPKAHVEAPLAGSMILAGVLLKLGGFGLYLLVVFFNWGGSSSYIVPFVVMLSLWGGLLAALMCMRQNDLKAMVAYSSIVHMGVVLISLTDMTLMGKNGALLIMLAHGFASSALFLVSYVTYKKVGSRSLSYLSGVLVLYPLLTFFWFVLCIVNMAVPPSLNLLGELFVIPAIWMTSGSSLIVFGVVMFMSVGYSMYMYSMVNHGAVKPYLLPGDNIGSVSILGLIIHLLPLMFLFKLGVLLGSC
uniref:NADH-ubiquinone oxidoreductase chain 4 n=1 Tax=Cerion tridentatum costellata TaxID=1108932 RepID=A0A1W6Q5F3_9EUPU|nr:NADH dehydrogenase subunit 4 [Cerion tridentatum costellata]